MATITKILYQCDRCLAISEEQPKSCTDYRADYHIKILEHYASCGGNVFEWDLLCDNCHKYVENLIKLMKVEQTESRETNAEKG